MAVLWHAVQQSSRQLAASAAAMQQHMPLLPYLAGFAAVWLVAEVLFYLCWFRPTYRSWNARCQAHTSPAAKSFRDTNTLFERFVRVCKEQPCDQDFLEQYLSTWFRGAAVADIRKGNMEELFSYGFYYRSRQQMVECGLGHIPSYMVSQFEGAFNIKFPQGYNPSLQFMYHLWEDLRAHWRPLSFYVGMEVLAVAGGVCMRLLGFKKRWIRDMPYWTRGIDCPSNSSIIGQGQQQQQPIVFIHGVVGLLLYLPLLVPLAVKQVPLLVLDMRHVGLRLSPIIPTIDALATGLATALEYHNLGQVVLMAHSYGTLVAGRLLRLNKAAVSRVVMMDPVCFGMFMPQLLYGFIYAPLKLDLYKPLSAGFNLFLWLVKKDIHLAATFGRRFYWSDMNLWPEDLPPGSCIVLGGADALVHAEGVQRILLARDDIKVYYKPGLIHGGFLLDRSTSSLLLSEATAVLAAAAASVAVAAGKTAKATAIAGAAATEAAAHTVAAAADAAADAARHAGTDAGVRVCNAAAHVARDVEHAAADAIATIVSSDEPVPDVVTASRDAGMHPCNTKASKCLQLSPITIDARCLKDCDVAPEYTQQQSNSWVGTADQEADCYSRWVASSSNLGSDRQLRSRVDCRVRSSSTTGSQCSQAAAAARQAASPALPTDSKALLENPISTQVWRLWLSQLVGAAVAAAAGVAAVTVTAASSASGLLAAVAGQGPTTWASYANKRANVWQHKQHAVRAAPGC